MNRDQSGLTNLTYQILVALADAERHGYGIIKEIEARSGPASAPSTGALYLALQRMEADGLIAALEHGPEGADRRRRYYGLTGPGKQAAARESARLAALVDQARAKGLVG